MFEMPLGRSLLGATSPPCEKIVFPSTFCGKLRLQAAARARVYPRPSMSDPAAEKSLSPLQPDNPAVIEHLKMIQAIITRLAGNSALCKSWCITIVAAIVAYAGTVKQERLVALAVIPLL